MHKFLSSLLFFSLGLLFQTLTKLQGSRGNENPLCSCSLETESTAHFFLCCRYYNNICITLMNESSDIDNSITSRQQNELLRIILYGDCKFKDNVNKRILTATIQFIINGNTFNQSLIQPAKNNKNDHTQPPVTFLLHFCGL